MGRRHMWAGLAAAGLVAGTVEGMADEPAGSPPAVAPSVSTVVVTATRMEQSSFDLPVSIDAFDKARIQDGQARVNLSEVLSSAPGVVSNNRQNYAQDLQISIRGFGARSTFGVRGVRLFVDGVPLTMPDGQGQAANIDLSSASRVEVMRGPFSTLYGNASGGVIAVFTEDGARQPTLGADFWAGSFGTRHYGLKAGGELGVANYLLDATRFDTDGYRQHSATVRDTENGKVAFELPSGGRLTVVANHLYQPGTQDPLGLTKAQVAANPTQAGNGAITFNTLKNVSNLQGGAVFEQPVGSADTLRLMAYSGTRQTYGTLAFKTNGVVDLNRDFEGVDGRWTHRAPLLGGPFELSAGFNYDRQLERRKGYDNLGGTAGTLRRNEDDTVFDADPYLQAQWSVLPRLDLDAGVRRSNVSYDSRDLFLSDGNSSGAKRFSQTTPVGGAVFKLTPLLNLYANAGKGFETPTLSEMAYTSTAPLSTGLNFALRPSQSKNYEVGAKSYLGYATRINAALFRIDTRDEIVVELNSNGRSVYQNAGNTRREGLELQGDSDLGHGFKTNLAYTLMSAQYVDTFKECVSACAGIPTLTVANGNRIPGVARSIFYGELSWAHPASGFQAALEGRWSARLYANDTNTDFAGAYATAAVRVGLRQSSGHWTLEEYSRVDNLFNRTIVGSVIVNATGGQYYEPAPGRTFLVGVKASYGF